MDPLWRKIEQDIQTQIDSEFRLQSRSDVGGGCINQTLRLSDGRRELFVKLTDATQIEMFQAEFEGLLALRHPEGPRIPTPYLCGQAQGQAYLVMEYLPLGGSSAQAAATLGHQLARLHQQDHRRYGWQRDNTIGSTPQSNTPAHDWCAFWGEQRLGVQLRLAQRNGASSRLLRRGEQLLSQIDQLLGDHRPVAAPLHGDLWGGNWAVDKTGAPVIFDPAFYYGDPETDLAMTELFGGFPPDFYAAYAEILPRDPDYGVRRDLYNLYHVLNHFNLFGSGYQGQAERLIERLLAEC